MLSNHPRSRLLRDLQHCVFAQVALRQVQRDRDRKLLQEAQDGISSEGLEVATSEVEVEFLERRHAEKALEQRAERNRRYEGAGHPRLLSEPQLAAHQVRAGLEGFHERLDADVFEAAAGEVELHHQQLDPRYRSDQEQTVRFGDGFEARGVDAELFESQQHLETLAEFADGFGGEVLVELEVQRGEVSEVDEVAAGLDDAFGFGVCAG